MPTSFILIIMALGLIGAGAVTLTKKSWGRFQLRREPIVKVRKACPETAPSEEAESDQLENRPAETTAQECELATKERDIVDEFIDPSTPEERKRELAKKLAEAGFEIRGKYAPQEQKEADAISNGQPVGTVGTEDGDNVVSMKAAKGQDTLNERKAVQADEEGTNAVSLSGKKPNVDTVDLDEFGVFGQNNEMTAGLRS